MKLSNKLISMLTSQGYELRPSRIRTLSKLIENLALFVTPLALIAALLFRDYAMPIILTDLSAIVITSFCYYMTLYSFNKSAEADKVRAFIKAHDELSLKHTVICNIEHFQATSKRNRDRVTLYNQEMRVTKQLKLVTLTFIRDRYSGCLFLLDDRNDLIFALSVDYFKQLPIKLN